MPSGAPDGTREHVGVRLAVASVCAIVVGLVARLTGLRTQGYWSDELFSIGEASSGWRHLLREGATEIHPPLFAGVLWVWLHLGGDSTNPNWVRLLPALFGVLAVPVCALGLRRTALSPDARLVLTVATACNGMSVVYGQEVRSYSLLFLAAVGLTAETMRLLAPRDGMRPTLRAFIGWGLLASATHLFGALLVGACALAVAVTGRRRADSPIPGLRRLVATVTFACLPQLLWLGYGAFVPGFAAGTDWLGAPARWAPWWWITTAFGCGDLVRQADGFRLNAPWLVIALAACVAATAGMAVVAAARRLRQRPRQPWRHASSVGRRPRDAAERRCAVVLGTMTLAATLVIFLIAQVVHIWLLRNMIAFVPALTWSVLLGILRLARGRGRSLISVLLVCALACASVGTWHAMQEPYKDQYAQAADRVADLQAADPDIHIIGTIASWWFTGSHHTTAEGSVILRSMVHRASPYGWSTPSSWRDVVWVFASADATRLSEAIIAQESGDCQQVPLVRVAMVVCRR